MPQALRITMLAPFGIRPKGTLSARMLPLARALVQRGHAVHIYAPPLQNPQDAGQSTCHDGVWVTHTALPSWPGPAGVAQQVAALLQPVFRAPPDVLHLFKPKGYSGLAALAARVACRHVPLVVDTDDWEGWGGWNDHLPYPHPAKMLFAWQERDLPRRAAAVTVASRTLETQVWGFGVPPERVIYVPNGIGDVPGAPVPAPAADTMLLYTRFWEFDVRDIVAALVAIRQRYPAVRLLVVGRGERGEEQVLLRLAEQAGVVDAIDYRGWVEPATLPALLASAQLALVPMDDTLINRARGLAKVLELMALGIPMVAARVGQIPEYLEDRQHALLVPPAAPGALALAAVELLRDQALCRRLGAAAHAQATRRFAWAQLAGDVERAYRIALRQR